MVKHIRYLGKNDPTTPPTEVTHPQAEAGEDAKRPSHPAADCSPPGANSLVDRGAKELLSAPSSTDATVANATASGQESDAAQKEKGPKLIPTNALIQKAEELGVKIPKELSEPRESAVKPDAERQNADAIATAGNIPGATEIDYLLSPVIPNNTITLLYGSPQDGRTLLSLILGFCVASGTKVFDAWTAKFPRNVLYLCGNRNEGELKNRIGKVTTLFARENQDKTLHGENFAFLSTRQVELDLTTPNGQARIERILFPAEKEMAAKLLIIDSLRATTNFDNSDGYWRNLFAWLDKLSRKNCAALIVHDDYEKDDARMFGFDNVIRVIRGNVQDAENVKLTVQIEKSLTIFKAMERTLKIEIDLDSHSPKWKNQTPNMGRAEKDQLIIQRYSTDKWPIARIAKELGVTEAALHKRIKILKGKKAIPAGRKISKPAPASLTS